MAQSTEYPDLRWVPPKAWGRGRDGKAVRFIVVHYTAGSERSTSAEDGAAYDQRRTDGTSSHYYVDSNSIVQCVKTSDRANTARHRGNRLGIQYELCGTQQTRAQWLDAASMATLRLAARQVARDCKRYGIPVRRLTTSETRRAWTQYPNGPRGIVGHVDCTNAYPEDGGDHTDPGVNFPWDVFLGLVREEMEDELSDADVTRIKAAIDARADATDAMIRREISATEDRLRAEFSRLPADSLTALIGDPDHGPREVRNSLVDLSGLRGYLVGAEEFSGYTHAEWPTSPLKRLVDAADKILKEDEPS